MSLQDKLEQILREMHVMIAQGEVYDHANGKVIIEKKQMFDLLNQLNVCIYEMMDHYEMTKQSRDKADREAKKRGDAIIEDSKKNAEDVYAASILYTNEALAHIQDIMADAIESFQQLCDDTKEKMKEEKHVVRSNQYELKGQLQDLVDTDMYLDILKERNKQIEKEHEAEKNGLSVKEVEASPYAKIKPEIKVNEEFLKKIYGDAGDFDEIAPLDENDEDFETVDLDKKKVDQPEIKVNTNAEYFKWIKNRKEES